MEKCGYCLWVIIMNRTNRIRIFFVTTLMSACLSFSLGYQIMKAGKNEQEKERLVAEETEQNQLTEEKTEISISNMDVSYEYMVVEEEGYLLVYMKDLKTVYMYTDIQISGLPYSLQKEIRMGKPFSDLKELYDFLENYSS